MSSGKDIPLGAACEILRKLKVDLLDACNSQAEQSAVNSLSVVGSVRRRRPVVHDIELVAPWHGKPAKSSATEADPLYAVLARLTANKPTSSVAASLFEVPKQERAVRPIFEAVRGLNAGFLACSLTLLDTGVPLQVYRSSADNFGWLTIYRTGPSEFGMWFLIKWKERYGISQQQQASAEGLLRDAGGRVVSVTDEDQAFRLCNFEKVHPTARDLYAERLNRQQSTDRSWTRR